MADIRLKRLPDRTPVKLVVHLTPGLHRTLSDYAGYYRDAYGEAASIPDLVPAMLDAFLATDKGFIRRDRGRQPAPTD